MNKTAIEWCDATWNPVTGCDGTCSYCYARQIARRFDGTKAFPNGFVPTMHASRMDDPYHLRKPSRIFVGSMTDMFGAWVTPRDMTNVLNRAMDNRQHTFYFLTKKPECILGKLADWPNDPLPNVWIGVTVTDRIMALAAKPHMVSAELAGWHTFVSVEPLLAYIPPILLTPYEWQIVGAQTGPGAKAHQPKREWVQCIVDCADADHVPVFLKDSVTALWPDMARREWPLVEVT